MFRLGLVEGKEVELFHRSKLPERSAGHDKRAEGDEVVGAIEDLDSRSG